MTGCGDEPAVGPSIDRPTFRVPPKTMVDWWRQVRRFSRQMKAEIRAELPEELLAEARALVEHGWAADFDHLLAEALRRYLDSHSERLTEAFLREDVKWGLHGRE